MKLSRMIAIFGILTSGIAIASHPWRTNDQQAATLFAQNKIPEAAAQFDDPAWRAAAQFKAGQYQQAIKTLTRLPKTSDNYYNLGNALAHAGQYQQAINAYNQALKQSPNDQDAKFNKEIVMSLLKKQQQKQQANSSSNESDKQSSDDSAAINKQQQAKQSTPTGKSGKADNQQASEGKQSSSTKTATANQHRAGGDKENNQQAARKSSQRGSDTNNTAQTNKLDAGKEQSTPSPSAEQSLAHQQKLRRVPDNPGRLLQQKLQRDYLNRHPEQQRW